MYEIPSFCASFMAQSNKPSNDLVFPSKERYEYNQKTDRACHGKSTAHGGRTHGTKIVPTPSSSVRRKHIPESIQRLLRQTCERLRSFRLLDNKYTSQLPANPPDSKLSGATRTQSSCAQGSRSTKEHPIFARQSTRGERKSK